MFWQKSFKCLISIFLLLAVFEISIRSALAIRNENFKTEEEESLYQQGITYRKEKKWQEAIHYFQPLAEKGYVRAQHNVATCFYHLSKPQEAFLWYSRASSQGFEPSKRNLNKMNFLAVLPEEMLDHVTGFLGFKDFVHFSQTCQSFDHFFRTKITRVNCLTSMASYGIEWRERFKDVVFDPAPQEMRLRYIANITEGPLEVHFRDPTHLRQIVEETPLVDAKEETFFVRDPHSVDGEEFRLLTGQATRQLFVHVVSDTPLNLSGNLIALPTTLVLPAGSDISQFNYQSKGRGLRIGKLDFIHNAQSLAAILEAFDERLYQIRTADAYKLFEDRRKSRLKCPSFYPDLLDLCPEVCIVYDEELIITQGDALTAKQPLTYIANTLPVFHELQQALPHDCDVIYYIDPDRNQAGVYCSGPLGLVKNFTLTTTGTLSFAGRILLPDYSLRLAAGGSLWGIGARLTLGGRVSIQSEGSTHLVPLTLNQKPEGLPEGHWERIKAFFRDRPYLLDR